MSVAEMKKAIIEKVETLSEEQLNALNTFIDGINKRQSKEYDLLPHVQSLVSEREGVLKKLAQ